MDIWVKQGLPSHHKVQVVLVALGDTPREYFVEYHTMITRFSTISFTNLTRPSSWSKSKSAFRNSDWNRGRFNFHFTLDDGVDGGQSAWSDYQAHKRVLAVIGVLHFPSCQDLAVVEKQFNSHLSGFRHARANANRIFVFGTSFDKESAPDPSNMVDPSLLVVFPPAGECEGGMSMMEVHMNVVLESLAVVLFQHLDTEAIRVKDSLSTGLASLFQQDVSFTLQTPFEKDDEVEKSTKRRRGRGLKWLGDLALLAGTPYDAADFYISASKDTKSGDPVWWAGSQEGLAATLIAMLDNGWVIPKELIFKNDDDNGKPDAELVEYQVLKKCTEALEVYKQKGQVTAVLECELAFKIARFYMCPPEAFLSAQVGGATATPEPRVREALVFLHRAVEVPFLDDKAQVARTLEVSMCCGRLGLKRKAALFLCACGMKVAQDGNACSALVFTQLAAEKYGVMQLGCIEKNECPSAFSSWAVLKKQVLELLIMQALQSEHFRAVAAYYSLLLQMVAASELSLLKVLEESDWSVTEGFQLSDPAILDLSRRSGGGEQATNTTRSKGFYDGLMDRFSPFTRGTQRGFYIPKRKEIALGTGLPSMPSQHALAFTLGTGTENIQLSMLQGMMLVTEKFGKTSPVMLPGIPLLHTVLPLEMEETLRPRVDVATDADATTVAASTFFYSPFDKPLQLKAQKVKWVLGEIGRVKAVFSNPLGVTVIVQGVEVIANDSCIVSFPVSFSLEPHIVKKEIFISLRPMATGDFSLTKLRVHFLGLMTEYTIQGDGTVEDPPTLLTQPWMYPRKLVQKKILANAELSSTDLEVLEALPFLMLTDHGFTFDMMLFPGEVRKEVFHFVNHSKICTRFIEFWVEEVDALNKSSVCLLFSPAEGPYRSALTNANSPKTVSLSEEGRALLQTALPLEGHKELAVPILLKASAEVKSSILCLKYSSNSSACSYRQLVLPLTLKVQEGLEVLDLSVYDLDTKTGMAGAERPQESRILVAVKIQNKSAHSFLAELSVVHKGKSLLIPKGPETDSSIKTKVRIEGNGYHSICGVMEKIAINDILVESKNGEDIAENGKDSSLLKETIPEALLKFISSRFVVKWELQQQGSWRSGALPVPSSCVHQACMHKILLPQLLLACTLGTPTPLPGQAHSVGPVMIPGENRISCSCFTYVPLVYRVTNVGVWNISNVSLRVSVTSSHPGQNMASSQIVWSGVLDFNIPEVPSKHSVEKTNSILFLEPGIFKVNLECCSQLNGEIVHDQKELFEYSISNVVLFNVHDRS